MIASLVTAADLEVLEIDDDLLRRHLAMRTMASAGAVSLSLVALGVWTHRPPSVALIVAATMAMPMGAVILVRRCRHVARQRRVDMEMAVAVMLDLVNVLLAGGAGPETALLTAASAGDGWAFDTIRSALSRAQQERRPHWQALDELGSRLEVGALADVAQSLRAATVNGGRIRQSLTARADALRRSNLARVEHEAERRTERMGVPMVVMFVGFVCFIGYPAMVTTMTTL